MNSVSLLPAALVGCVFLTACNPGDWRHEAINAAEAKIRTEVGDDSAVFSGVQVTGDSRSGQTCGYVEAENGPLSGAKGRFIVYIDGAGPFVEHHMGRKPMSQDRFDFAWRYDCLKEGYRS